MIVPTHLLKMQFNMLKSVVAHLLEHGEQLHFFSHAVLIVYDEKTKAKSLNCARVRSHVVVPTHLLHERCNLTC